MKTLLKTLFLILAILSYGQVGIGTNTPAEGSLLDVDGNGSIVLPRVSLVSPTSKAPIIAATSTATPEAGMILYNTNANLSEMPDGTGVYFWNGTQWEKLKVGAATTNSLWYETGTTNYATSITQKITRDAEVTLGDNVNRAGALLNLEADDRGLLLPRVELVDVASTVPLITPSTPASLEQGMTVYHIGTNGIEEGVYYWDDAKWSRLFVNTSTNAGNDGVVKITSGDGALETLPSLNLNKSGNAFGAFQRVEYLPSLNYATASTYWPENITSPSDSDIYDFTTNRFLENSVVGQVHMWRVILSMESQTSSSGSIMGRIYNPDSGFQTTSVQLIPSGGGGTNSTFLFFTIADGLSIGSGYEIGFSANIQLNNIKVESVTRVSLFKD